MARGGLISPSSDVTPGLDCLLREMPALEPSSDRLTALSALPPASRRFDHVGEKSTVVDFWRTDRRSRLLLFPSEEQRSDLHSCRSAVGPGAL